MKVTLPRIHSTVLLVQINQPYEIIGKVLEEANVQDEVHQAILSKYFTNLAGSLQLSVTQNINIQNHLDTENKPAEMSYLPYDQRLQRENEERIHALTEKLNWINRQRNLMESTLKQLLNSKVAKLIDTALSGEMVVQMNNPKTNMSVILDLEEFFKRKLKRNNLEAEAFADKLLSIQESFDLMKRECTQIHKDIVNRTGVLEVIKKANFDELEEYEKILIEK